jgi:Arc/MetJ-type ribon-helix-helix transcriptional regulator
MPLSKGGPLEPWVSPAVRGKMNPNARSAAVKVQLTPDAAQWVEAEIAAGTFPTAEDALRYAVSELRVNALRATLDSAVAEGGRHTTADARAHVRRAPRRATV